MVLRNVCFTTVLLFFVGGVKFTTAQVPYFGACPVLKVQPNFMLDSYQGTWFEAEKYPTIATTFGRCTTARYFYDNNRIFRIYQQQITAVTNQEDSILGVMWSEGGARLRIALPAFPYREENYWVLATDYCSYSVVFTCHEAFGLYHNRYVWILTRARHPTPDVLLNAYNAMDDNGLERKHLRRTQQNGCEDYTPAYLGPPPSVVCV